MKYECERGDVDDVDDVCEMGEFDENDECNDEIHKSMVFIIFSINLFFLYSN